jgi:hypothetical protein
MDELDQTTTDGLKISLPSLAYLSEASKWAKFLAIMGFIFCGIIVIVAFFVGTLFSGSMGDSRFAALGALGGAGITILYIILGLIYFFPCLYLFNFASKMQVAIRSRNQYLLDDSFKNLKSCFKFMGIFTIVILSFYVLIIIFAMVIGVVMH